MLRNYSKPNLGYVIAGVLILLPVLVLKYVVPFFDSGLDLRLESARATITKHSETKQALEAVKSEYLATFSKPLTDTKSKTLYSSGELSDRLQAAALVDRKKGQLKVQVLRPQAGRCDEAILLYCFPKQSFERFKFEIEGTVEDVVDYLLTQVEVYPYYYYISFQVLAPVQRGQWPRYVFEVWLPVTTSEAIR
jgi:hypothetical protein